MKIKCIANTGKAFEKSSNKPAFTSSETVYGALAIDEVYNVMAIMVCQEVVYYLADTINIGFFPYQLFDVVDNKIPTEWYFRPNKLVGDLNILSICGYYEICFVDEHYDELLDQEERAVALFIEKRNQIFGY